MIQLNLLPDVKLQFIKASRLKRLVTLISVAVSIVAIAIFAIVLIAVDVVQKKNLSDLTKDINSYSAQLKSVPDLDKILTVQNQLTTINSLHDQKVVASRLFTYLGQVTPQKASLNSVGVDFSQQTINITGDTPSLDVVNAYVDTLKAATYKLSSDGAAKPAFSSVVLTSFSRSPTSATYGINFKFDSAIFSAANNPTLTVPNTTSTDPALLFKKTGN